MFFSPLIKAKDTVPDTTGAVIGNDDRPIRENWLG